MSDSQGDNYYRHLQRDEAISSERLVRRLRCLCLGVRLDAYCREVVGVRMEIHVDNHLSKRARSAGTLHYDRSPGMGIPLRSPTRDPSLRAGPVQVERTPAITVGQSAACSIAYDLLSPIIGQWLWRR